MSGAGWSQQRDRADSLSCCVLGLHAGLPGHPVDHEELLSQPGDVVRTAGPARPHGARRLPRAGGPPEALSGKGLKGRRSGLQTSFCGPSPTT